MSGDGSRILPVSASGDRPGGWQGPGTKWREDSLLLRFWDCRNRVWQPGEKHSEASLLLFYEPISKAIEERQHKKTRLGSHWLNYTAIQHRG